MTANHQFLALFTGQIDRKCAQNYIHNLTPVFDRKNNAVMVVERNLACGY